MTQGIGGPFRAFDRKRSNRLETHLSTAELVGYHERVLGAEELLRVDDHIGQCGRCRRLLGRLERTGEAAESIWQELSGSVEDQSPTVNTPDPTLRQLPLTMARIKHRPVAAKGMRWLLALGGGLAVVTAIFVIAALRNGTRPSREQGSQADVVPNETPKRPVGDRPDGADKPGADSAPTTIGIVAVILDSGRTVTIDDQRNLKGLEDLQKDWQQSILWAVEHRRLSSSPKAVVLSGQNSKLRGRTGDGPGPALIHPVGIVVETRRPTLAWEALADTLSYRVSIFDSAYREVASSGPQTRTEWKVPFALRRGRVYSWQVTAKRANGEVVSPVFPSPEAKFMILDSRSVDDLARANRLRPRSHLLMAVLYSRAGLPRNAARELSQLQNENLNSKLVQDLTRSLTGGER